MPNLDIDILLCFQAITYFLLYVSPDVHLDLHTKFSFVVIGASLIQELIGYNSPYSSFVALKSPKCHGARNVAKIIVNKIPI